MIQIFKFWISCFSDNITVSTINALTIIISPLLILSYSLLLFEKTNIKVIYKDIILILFFIGIYIITLPFNYIVFTFSILIVILNSKWIKHYFRV